MLQGARHSASIVTASRRRAEILRRGAGLARCTAHFEPPGCSRQYRAGTKCTRVRDLGDHDRLDRAADATRQLTGWIAPTLNHSELIHTRSMLEGLACDPTRVLVCTRNGHSDGQMALEVPEQ